MKFDIPLFYKTHTTKGNGGLPELYPFYFGVDESLGLPCQRGSKDLREILTKIYMNGTMMTGSMNSFDMVGMMHANNSLEFILNNYKDYHNKDILEIGCGGGYIISKLSERGGRCVGLEPGSQSQTISTNNIRVINDYFPTEQLNGSKFDLITHFNVLEHIESPQEMLREIHSLLKDDGTLIFGVPEAESYLKNGDISIFLHEHFNYFTTNSLKKVLQKSGFKAVKIEPSSNNAMVFLAANKLSDSSGSATSSPGDFTFSLTDFSQKYSHLKDSLRTKLTHFPSQEKIAIYCPNRAMNVLSELGMNDVRIVDDTPIMHGQFYPYFNRPIENFNDLKNSPPDLLIIFSISHGQVILQKCMSESRLNKTEKLNISSFYK